MVDDRGLILGIHFHKYRKVSLSQISIIKAALSDAARKIDELNAKKNLTPEITGAESVRLIDGLGQNFEGKENGNPKTAT